MKLFDTFDYAALHTLFDPRYNYSGYKPEVVEAPNGDGKLDILKRYLHVAIKYDPPEWAIGFLARAHFEACRIAEALKIPDQYYPKINNGTLRVLEYPPGSGSAEHTDFDLFTVHCYRDTPENFVRLDAVDPRAEAIDPDVHLGEISEVIGAGIPTRHYVPALPCWQKAIVYFAMPDNNAILPSGISVGDWLAERYARSRSYK